MIQNNTINFAVIGCGHIGKRHAEMIERNPESRLVALVDTRDPDLLSLSGNTPFFSSLDDFLNDSLVKETDVINIATPNGYHASQALKCLEAKKHVVLEKPIALCKHDAERIIYRSLN